MNTKVFLLLITLLFKFNCINAVTLQSKLPKNILSYYQNTSKANNAIFEKKYSEAIKYYIKAFRSIKNPLFQDEFGLAICYAKMKNKEECVKHLILSINKTSTLFFFNEYFNINKNMLTIIDSDFNFIQKNPILFNDIFSLCINKKQFLLSDSIRQKYLDTARYFYANDMYYSESNKDNPILKTRFKDNVDTNIKDRVEFENKLVDFMLKSNNYIGVNNFGNEIFFTCVLHLSEQNLNTVFPILDSAFINMTISPYVYGAFLERRNRNNNYNSCYGYWIMHFYNCEKEDYKNIIENRKIIGMNNLISEDDYSMNCLSKKYRLRTRLPWYKK